VLTTVWRGYSPLAGSTDDYRSQTRRSNGLFSRLIGHVSTIEPVLDQRPICESSHVQILLVEQAQILDGELPEDSAHVCKPAQSTGAALGVERAGNMVKAVWIELTQPGSITMGHPAAAIT